MMNLMNIGGFSLESLGPTNVILGKNGSGKSYLLKTIEGQLSQRPRTERGHILYISPERGGLLTYEPHIEQSIANNPAWLGGERRKNQAQNFRQQSTVLFRRLELLELREIERDHIKPGYVPRNFEATIDKLNVLLDRIKIVRHSEQGFRLVDRVTNVAASPEQISSGESELVSLGIEFLSFVRERNPEQDNILFVDEPDVHLHPDLQYRLAKFIVDVLKDKRTCLILATHSTPLLAGLAEHGDAKVAFMRRGDKFLSFKSVNDIDRTILPIFGAHPLSNVFNKSPILLLEGEDDERIWQQALRSSKGQIRIFPCAVDGVSRFHEYETEVSNIMDSVYDDAAAFSLRDRDLHPDVINDVGKVKRMRLSCRSAENLMLTDDVLKLADTDWPSVQADIIKWVAANPQHQYIADMKAFVADGIKRKEHDLKKVRNILIGLFSNKPWEVLVGQSIAALTRESPQSDGSLRSFLGTKVCEQILKLPA